MAWTPTSTKGSVYARKLDRAEKKAARAAQRAAERAERITTTGSSAAPLDYSASTTVPPREPPR